MTRQVVSTNSWQGVAAGQTAFLDLPTGPITYHALRITYGTSTSGGATKANMESELTQWRIKVNGKAQRTFSTQELFDYNEIHGRPANTGEIPIFFAPPWSRSAQGEDALAWGTLDVDTLQVEVDIASGASSPTLSARVEVERVARPMGPISKFKRFTQPVSATGITVNTTLPRVDDYYGIYAWSADIDDVEIKVDQAEFFKLTDDQLRYLLEDHGWTHVAGVLPLKFDYTGRVADSLKMRGPDGSVVRELRVDWNMGAATGFTFLTETLGLRD